MYRAELQAADTATEAMESTLKEEREHHAAATDATVSQLRAALLSEQRTTESLQHDVILCQQQRDAALADLQVRLFSLFHQRKINL